MAFWAAREQLGDLSAFERYSSGVQKYGILSWPAGVKGHANDLGFSVTRHDDLKLMSTICAQDVNGRLVQYHMCAKDHGLACFACLSQQPYDCTVTFNDNAGSV